METAARRTVHRLLTCWMLAGVPILCAGTPSCTAQEQYPKPLIHTPTDHPAARVLLIGIDGMHASDLANWVAAHPHSALAELTARGVTYTNAHTPIADPAAGLVALATGGTPISTGIVSSDGYDHALSPPGSSCRTLGTPIVLASRIDSIGEHAGGFVSSSLPLDPGHGCVPLSPHNLLRVNTIFEVVHEKIGRTAWVGENTTMTDLLRGPSGQGLDDACSFEQHASGDAARVAAVLHWIDGKDCTGSHDAPVPALFGMNLTSVAAAQAAKGMGYVDAGGTPSAGLEKSVLDADEAIGRLVEELKAKHLYDSTWIFVTSAYGQAPMDQRQLRLLPVARLREVANTVQPAIAAHVSGGDSAMIWLNDPAKTGAVAKAYSDRAAALGIQEIYSGAKLALTLNSPKTDSRMPDIILQAKPGVIWGPSNETVLASYGGISDSDTHVALLVSGAQLTGRCDPTYVPTTQLAPLLLRALGMEKFDLQALHKEHSPALPGIF